MNHEDATRRFYSQIWPYRAMVLRTSRFLTRNHAEADDLAQETLVKAFKAIDHLDENAGASVKGWLSAILRNTWIDHLRATGRHGAPFSLHEVDMDMPITSENSGDVAPDLGDPAALLERFSDADLIKGLRSLPEEIRWTLLLVDVESLAHAEAAQVLGVPEGTVKSRAHRGRAMLREYLMTQERGGSLPAPRELEELP